MAEPFIIGWEEWVALPELGLPAIKAKVDTGARTSALHAHQIEPFGSAHAPLVRFNVHPIAGKTDIEITCSAPIVDRREVTSSNGEREMRYVIATHARIGSRTWPIEVTLTDRQSMAYRMLLGRQAIQDDMLVEPASSFRQPKLSYKPYRHFPARDHVRRALRIALLSEQPDGPGTQRLASAASAHSHVVETIPLRDVVLTFDGLLPGLLLGSAPIGHFDIVIPRFSVDREPIWLAVLRQMELMGSASLNAAEAMRRLADPLAVRQTLHANGIAMPGLLHIAASPATAIAPPPGSAGDETPSQATCVLVVGRTAVATRIPAAGAQRSTAAQKSIRQIRSLAVKCARILNLRLAAIDIIARDGTLLVAYVSPFPQLELFAEATGVPLEPYIIADAESQVRSWVRHADEQGEPTPPPVDE